MNSYTNRFVHVADDYRRFRPTYPVELFSWLAGAVPRHDTAWDCATGNGQAATSLARHFDHVIATDASEAQIAAATPAPGVEYRVAPCERSGLPDRSVTLITVAQAIHWFDVEPFYDEVRRVLRPDGIFAIWCYRLTRVTPEVDAIIDRWYDAELATLWSPRRRHVDDGYANIPFPFQEIETPTLTMQMNWSLDDFAAYLSTWSAVQTGLRQTGTSPVAVIEADLRKAWGAPARRRDVLWPLTIRAGHATG